MSTLVDISSQIDEAFDECKCEWIDDTPHDGPTRALANYHGCDEFFWCAGHYQIFITEHLPAIRSMTSQPSGGRCRECLARFYDIDSYIKVYPL